MSSYANSGPIGLVDARREAEAFRALFLTTATAHQVAGSVRRGKSWCNDIEHVVIGEGICRELDAAVANGAIHRQIKSDGHERWGERYRACVYRDRVHEVFIADELNWGAILAIRTGDSLFSQQLVTKMLAGGKFRQIDGYVRDLSKPEIGLFGPTGEYPTIVPCHTEESFFALCGMDWMKPEKRQ